MANNLTIRFYSVEKLGPQGLTLQQALENVAAQGDFGLREKQLTAGYTVRLERYAVDAGDLSGEFTRVRTTDFPFEVADDGVHPLQTDGPIGNGIAFRFRPADHMLAMQYDPRIVSPARAMEYLRQYDGRGGFRVTPKIDPENWRKFRDSPLRKLRVGVASPNHMEDIEDEGAAVSQSLKALGEAYGAPVITIEMGMGNRKGALLASAKGLAREIFDKFASGGADLRSLKARVKVDEGEPAEEINLLDEVLSDKFSIDLPANNPNRNYEMRDAFIKQQIANHD